MPHPRNAGMVALMVSGSTRLVRCWVLTPAVAGYDTIRLTEHNRALVFGGETYVASPGVNASAVSHESGTRSSNVNYRGAITSDLITAEDLRAGVYRGATLEEFLVDWRYPWVQKLRPMKYTLGASKWNPVLKSFEVDVAGLISGFESKVGELYERTCPYNVFDEDCRRDRPAMDPAMWTRDVEVLTVVDRDAFTADVDGGEPANGWFNDGAILWVTGNNAGLGGICVNYASHAWNLLIPMPHAIQVGDTFTALPGCNKLAGVTIAGLADGTGNCKYKFNNMNNFGGFPFIPTNDKILVTPDVHQ